MNKHVGVSWTVYTSSDFVTADGWNAAQALNLRTYMTSSGRRGITGRETAASGSKQ